MQTALFYGKGMKDEEFMHLVSALESVAHYYTHTTAPTNRDEINWNQVLINSSISAMQGIQESGKLGMISDIVPEELAKLSVKIGECLVKELQNKLYNNGSK